MIHLWWLLEYCSNDTFETFWNIPHASAGKIINFMQQRVYILLN